LPEVAGDGCGDGDDGCPCGQLFHHGVQSGVLQGQVCFEDGGDHVPQRFGPFRDPQDVVVQVVVGAVQIRRAAVRARLSAVPEDRVDQLTHWKGDPAELDEVLADLVGAALHDGGA
jgi:hypothetical protein